MDGQTLGFLAATVIGIAGLPWLYLMQRSAIPADRRAFVAASAASVLLGIAAFVVGPGLAGGVAAGVGVAGGLVFLALHAASGQAPNEPAVPVGGRVLEFTATRDDGEPFDL